jgi:membrane protein involved in colicin uptake
MSKRYAVLGLSVVFALALAVPALGGPSNPIASTSASVKQTANKALKTAKAAKKTANSAASAASAAQSTANSAESNASKALTEAKKGVTAAATAQSTANTAKSTADSAKSTADSAKTAAAAASAAAAAAEANANTRVKSSIQRAGETTATDTTASKLASVSCQAGEVVTGGGYSVGGESNKVTVSISEEQLYGGGWFVNGQTIAGQTANWALTAIAICGTK